MESVAVGGDGVAREETGRVVFVPRSAPGDRVRVRLTEDHGSYARARLESVRSPGGDRSPSPCRYYEACGGCQLQHLSGRGQLTAKRRAVADSLERIGGLEVDVPPVIAVGSALGYRNRVTLTLRREAAGAPESGADRPGVRAGYHRHEDPDEIVDVRACPLAEPRLNRAWRELRAGWGPGASALPGGQELRVTLRATAKGEVGLVVEGGLSREPGDPERVEEVVDGLAGYAWRPAGGRRRILAGRPTLRERWDGRELAVDLETFLQVNRAAAAAMERELDRLLEPVAGRRILDLYAGVGTRALRWSEGGAEAAACEADEEAVESGRRAARRYALDVTFRRGRVEEHLPGLLPTDAAVVNPPRTGLSRRVADVLREAPAERLAYVSCDPATLARDLKRLSPGWRVTSVQPFDAFPQTAHVETIVALRRR